jgi:RNA polymerase sigma factor (sigma-70 family)
VQHLSAEEQRRLVRRAQGGDTRARERLAESNQGFVRSTAQQYTGRGVPFEDLVQEGNVGLLTAIDKFDLTQPVKFMTYAAYWIKQAMGRACEQSGTAERFGHRVPAHLYHAFPKVERALDQFAFELDREPTVSELSQRAEVPEAQVEWILRLRERSKLSTDAGCEEGAVPEGVTLADTLVAPDETDEQVAAREQSQAMRDLLAALSGDEREVLTNFYGLDGERISEAEMVRRLGVTRGRLIGLRQRAVRKLMANPALVQLVGDRELTGELAYVMASQSCGHLRRSARLEHLPGRTLGPYARAGQLGEAWWLINMPLWRGCPMVDQYQLRLFRGTGQAEQLAQALRRWPEPQRTQLAEFVVQLPLQQADECQECAEQQEALAA